MLSKNTLKRGIQKREETDLTKLQLFRQATEGKYFLPAKKVAVPGLAVSGTILDVKKVYRGESEHPFAQNFRFLITGCFSQEDVGDPTSCKVIDGSTAYIYPLWSEHFVTNQELKTKFYTEHPNASKDREYTYGKPVGKITLKPLNIIDIQVVLKEPAPGVPAPLLTTSAGPVKPGSWVTFTNLSYGIRRHKNRCGFEASNAIPHPRAPQEDYKGISEFIMATLPIVQLPSKLVPTTQEQVDTLNEIERLMEDTTPASAFFTTAIEDIKTELMMEPALMDQLKTMMIFRNVTPEYTEFLNCLGVDVQPFQLTVTSGYSAQKNSWNTLMCTVNACLVDEDGDLQTRISYKLKCSDADSVVRRKLCMQSWPGKFIVPKLVEAVRDSLIFYCTVDIQQSLHPEILAGDDGQALTDGTLVAKIQDLDLDLVGAIVKTGIQISAEAVKLLFKNNELGTADCRKAPMKDYDPTDEDVVVNLTECSMKAGKDRYFYLVAGGIPQIGVERYKDKIVSHFNGDVDAASQSLVKYLLKLKGCDEAMWVKDVERVVFKTKMYEAPMIFGIKKEAVDGYKPAVPMTANERFKAFAAWQKNMQEFYLNADSENPEAKRLRQSEDDE